MSEPELTVWNITRGQRMGANCINCSRPLTDNAVPVGKAVGYWGAHNLTVTVFACPACPPTIVPVTETAPEKKNRPQKARKP